MSFLWPTGWSRWHYTLCEKQSHHSFSYAQPTVCECHCTFLWKASLVTSFPATNSLWVSLQIVWNAVLSHFFSHIFSYDQQVVGGDIAHFVKGSLITSFPMPNQQYVSDIAHFVKGSLITFCFLYDQQDVSDIHLWKAVSSHLFLWPTGSEWHCTFCKKAVSSHLFLWLIGCESHCTPCERHSYQVSSNGPWLSACE